MAQWAVQHVNDFRTQVEVEEWIKHKSLAWLQKHPNTRHFATCHVAKAKLTFSLAEAEPDHGFAEFWRIRERQRISHKMDNLNKFLEMQSNHVTVENEPLPGENSPSLSDKQTLQYKNSLHQLS